MALTGLAIAAALALAKDQLIDRPKADRKRKVEAIKEQGSPWTKEHGNAVDDPDTAGTLLQYGTTGASIGQGYKNSQSQNAFRDELTKRVKDGYSPYGYGSYNPAQDSLGGEDYVNRNSFGSYDNPYAKPKKDNIPF